MLVTGGAGFIGSHAALRLLEDGHRVTIVVCHSTLFNQRLSTRDAVEEMNGKYCIK